MKKRILPICCLIVTVIALLLPVCASAASLDTEAQTSLTLYYQKGEVVFPQLQVGVYRVAEALPDGSFRLIEPYASYPVRIDDITDQKQWQDVAQTLFSYIVAHGVAPDQTVKTDDRGVATFNGLKTGLYYVQEVVAQHTDGDYVFNRFMIYLPTPNADGSHGYEVEARPKCTEFIPKTQYTVTKLWQDALNSQDRPKEVTVDIYRNGVLQETQVLSARNNWTYTWFVTGEDQGGWTVTEREMPEHYKVTLRQNGSSFTLVNSRQGKPQPPKTGDTFNPLPWVLVMCFSGVLLLIVSIYGRRRLA